MHGPDERGGAIGAERGTDLREGCTDQQSQFVNGANVTPPTITAITRETGGTMQVHFAGVAGYTYVLNATTNFAGWSPVNTNTASVDGPMFITDPDAASYPMRFYRLALP